MFIERMKWPDVDALQRESVIVVCCISSLEQHSLHLPIGTDYFIGSGIIRRLEERLPDRLLCLPAIWLGASGHHMGFAGTVTASTNTMQRIVHDIACSVRLHSFKKLLIVNSHGGNRALLGCCVQDLGEEFPDLMVVGATYWDVAGEDLGTLLSDTCDGGMGHACEIETSVMLALEGSFVDMSRAEPDGMVPTLPGLRANSLCGPRVATYRSMKTSSSHGGHGDPRSATKEKGQQMLDAIVGRLAELCETVLDCQM